MLRRVVGDTSFFATMRDWYASHDNGAANTVAENAANGTAVGITALATDADAGTTISYSLTDNAGGRFAINATTGVVTVAEGRVAYGH